MNVGFNHRRLDFMRELCAICSRGQRLFPSRPESLSVERLWDGLFAVYR